MANNGEKKLYTSYEEAERVAESMRTRFKESFIPYKVEGGWEVGGVHVKSKTPYKREKVKAFDDIRALFDDVVEPISQADVVEYANQIAVESIGKKVSEVNGDGEGWRLACWKVMSGVDLEMNNDTSYLVLTVENNEQVLRIQMGGAFSRHIPLISAQAESLRGRRIVWHTWNPARQPKKWQPSKWFYMIEPVGS